MNLQRMWPVQKLCWTGIRYRMNTFTEISLRLQGLNVVFLFPHIALFAAKVFNIENYFHISIQVCDAF